MSLEAAILCSALNLHHEARGESILGQYAVVHVTRNRAKYNPDKVCGIVFAHKQFSWTINMSGHNSHDFEKAIHIAHMAWLSQDITYGATHYHSVQIRPYWAAKMKRTARIGNHIFYRGK
jgi:spore germination cell wall hydrolase CwlJ-like protein